jgi:predicted metal-binding protein
MDIEMVKEVIAEAGFSHIGALDCDTIHLLPEVREMCKDNTCGVYGCRWSCPPGCGTLEECEARVRKYKKGILVQTVGELEDSMDFEGMMEAEKNHKAHFMEARKLLQEKFPGMLALGAGACEVCQKCTYPDKPCRFPEKSISSMESYGMLVNQVCTDNQMKYYYGPGTIAYTSCFLLE